MTYYYALFAVFAVVIFLIVVDNNVAVFIDLMVRYAGVQLKRVWWMVRFHPKNPISKFVYERRLNKMIKEFEKNDTP